MRNCANGGDALLLRISHFVDFAASSCNRWELGIEYLITNRSGRTEYIATSNTLSCIFPRKFLLAYFDIH